MTKANSQYIVNFSGVAYLQYPIIVLIGQLNINESRSIFISNERPLQGMWGKPVSHILSYKRIQIPFLTKIVWLSIVERKFYSLVEKLPVEKMEELFEQKEEDSEEARFEQIVVGMTPYGGVAVWTYGFKKSVLMAWMQAEEIQVEMKDFMTMNPTVTLDEYCDFYINNDSRVKENLEKNGLPPRHLFDKYMQQFTYRYLVLFEHWDKEKEQWCSDSKSSPTDSQSSQTESNKEETKPEFDYIEEALFDGTHDKLHDGGLMNYHQAGKPKKLAVKWHIKKSEYMAYFWFEDEAIREVFDRFYGAHPETKTDFMIRIDSEKKKFELALYRYGLKEPQVISDSAYQLIVFKNKFEYYRSENYDQPRGAWIW